MTSTHPPTAVGVACAQLAPVLGDPAANRRTAEAAIAEAAGRGARLVVLPELCSSGYVFRSAAEARSLAEPADGPTVEAWAGAAARHRVVVVGGFCELGSDGRLHNSAAVLDGDRLLGVHRKIHLWDRERLVFAPGEAPAPVLDTSAGRVGVGICYDGVFPELTRSLALAGADIIALPANSLKAAARVTPRVVATATAYSNRVFVALCDRTGTERGVEWNGASAVIDTDGVLLAGATGPEPAVIAAVCDLARARDKTWGERNDLFGDRRPELYC